MARSNFSARRIPNGTYGSYWLDGERMAECYGCQAKVRMKDVQDGVIPEGTIVSKLADPDSVGYERIAYYGVMFSDLTLADWQTATVGKITAPFTFTRYELLDAIEVQ